MQLNNLYASMNCLCTYTFAIILLQNYNGQYHGLKPSMEEGSIRSFW